VTVTHQLADGGSIVRDRVPSTDVVRVRFAEIDGLKALAIIAIVAYQTMRFVGLPPGTAAAVLRLCDDASQGLAIFFVLTGFALAYPALAALGSDGAAYLDVARYAIKRVIRIYPAYLAVLTLTAALHPLALLFDLQSVANAVPVFDSTSFARAASFAQDTGNDGLAAVGLVVRGYLVFPALLALWVRLPGGALAVAVVAALLDLFTAAHGWGIGIVVPLVLGIAAADVRIGRPRLARFGWLLAFAGGAVAWFLEPHLGTLPGPAGPPGMLRIDPFWSVAAVGLLAGVSAVPPIERLMTFGPVRLLGAASYAISLVAMPLDAFAARHVTPRLGSTGIALVSAAAAVIGGFVVWQVVDRFVGDDRLRRHAAEALGPRIEAILMRFGAARIVLGRPPLPQPRELHVVPVSPQNFYTPPPRPSPAEVAVMSMRSGSADELAAEIREAKRRLGERSAILLADEPERHPAEPAVAPGLADRAKPHSSPAPRAAEAREPGALERRAIHLRIAPDRRKDDG
jgi:peptidoglycan/LPS O-acetylase OafA/YrhL